MRTVTGQDTTPDPWSDRDHDDWAGLDSRMRHLVADIAQRTDLITRFRPVMKEPGVLAPPATLAAPPAVFVPALAEIRFTAQALLRPRVDDPATIDPADRRDQAAFPVLAGAAAHEAGHAAHTTFTIPAGTPPDQATWALLLEEPRMEGQVLRRRPDLRPWLVTSARELCAGGALRFRAEGDVDPAESAFRAMTLLGGRWLAGVLTQDDVTLLRQDVAAVITDDTLHDLEELLRRAVALEDGDIDGLLRAARDLLDLLAASSGHEDPEDDEDDTDQAASEGTGTPADGQGSAPNDQPADGPPEQGTGNETSSGHAQQMPCGSWTAGDIDDDTDPYTQSPSPDAGQLDDQIADRAEDTLEEAAAAATAPTHPTEPDGAQAAAEKRAQETRGRQEAANAWRGACGEWSSGIRTRHHRPTPDLVEQARALTRQVRRAAYRGVTRTTTPAPIPPGRMRMGEEVRRQAQIAARTRITATPYRQTHRREVQNPPLLVGFAGDVSGSMDQWARVTAGLAWSLAQTSRHVDAQVAAVYWDSGIRATISPGQAPRTVETAKCAGGSTGCPQAIDALDGALGLTHNADAARLLVIVTDGAIGHTRPDVARRAARLEAAGVSTLWVTPTPDTLCPEVTNVVIRNPDRFGNVVGRAIVDTLASYHQGG